MALIDAIVINDELDLLEFRFDYLDSSVDAFVVAESRQTFSGAAKDLVFWNNRARFQRWANKTHHFMYEPITEATRWERQEVAKAKALSFALTLAGDGAVQFMDVDEFPSRDQMQAMRSLSTVKSIPLTTYYRRANWRVKYSPYLPFASAVPLGTDICDVPGKGMHQVGLVPVGGSPGAHFSYLGFDAAALATKYASFSQADLDHEGSSDNRLLQLADALRLDHLGRTTWKGNGLLEFQAPSEWSDVQHALYQFRPTYFDLEVPRSGIFDRLLGATLIDRVISRGDRQLIEWIPQDTQLFPAGLAPTQRTQLTRFLAQNFVARAHKALKRRVWQKG